MKQTGSATALLIMDMQTAMLSRLPDADGSIDNAAKAIAHARSQSIPVIYVTVGFRPGAPEISAVNKGFAAAKERFLNADMNEFVKIIPAIAPLPGEVVVLKKRVSAFSGSDLEVLLRAFGIQHLVLCGYATSGVVLSTLREAADKDYGLTVLSDCCADADEEVHRILTAKIFPRQADVFSVDEWIRSGRK